MALYSVNGGYPGKIPVRVRLPSGETRTALLEQYSLAELGQLFGIVEVADPPAVDADVEKLVWTGSAWAVTPLSAAELAKMQELKKKLVRQEADRRIGGLFEDWEIVNNTAASFLLVGVGITNLGPAQQALWGKTQADWTKVRDVRQAQRTLQQMDPIPADYQNDVYWPAI